MTRTSHRIVARYPLWGFILMTAISLVAIYLCADLRLFHHIEFSNGVNADSPWFWVILGGAVVLLVHSLRQMVLRPPLLQADLTGLRLAHRVGRPRLFLSWDEVMDIGRGEVRGSSENGPTTTPAIRFVVKTRDNLGGVISGMTQAEGDSVCFCASLFEADLDKTIISLREIQAAALGRPLKS
jgi:hypothetical protein